MARDSRYFRDLIALPFFADPHKKARLLIEATGAEDAIARLDERLTKSPIRQGWCERMDFADATASLWVEGKLVAIEDILLHDGGMDLHAPDQHLARAHEVLRLRRRMQAAHETWPFSRSGISALIGAGGTDLQSPHWQKLPATEDDDFEKGAGEDEAELVAALTAVDEAVDRSKRLLAHDPKLGDLSVRTRSPPEDVEVQGLNAWLQIIEVTRSLPPVLAAATALYAWEFIDPIESWNFLGRLLCASLLRQRGKTRAHLASANVGIKLLPLKRRREKDPTERISAYVEALKAAAEFGLAEHERWINARASMLRIAAGRRKSSHLPELIDYAICKPVITSEMIAKDLKVTPRAAQMLVQELGLRETTGRNRYRAWSII